jgi:hypothetical protein
MVTRILAPDQSVSRRPFTSVALYERDLTVLGYMLEDLRALMEEMAAGRLTVVPYGMVEWTVHGLRRRNVVCDPMRLHLRNDVHVVGFFGERNLDRDPHSLEEANTDVVAEFRNFPGILSYSSMELAGGNWANLVLHDQPEARAAWRTSQIHAKAVAELSPVFYRTVRIHNGVLPAGVAGGRNVKVERTKYWDYRSSRIWTAVRDLAAPPVQVSAH